MVQRDRPQVRIHYSDEQGTIQHVTLDVDIPVRPTVITRLEFLVDDMLIISYPFTMNEELYVRTEPDGWSSVL